MSYVILPGQEKKEIEKIIQLAELTVNKLVVTTNRKTILELFLHLADQEANREKLPGIPEIVQFMDCFFDFRSRKNPHCSISLQSLETELYNLKREKEKEMK